MATILNEYSWNELTQYAELTYENSHGEERKESRYQPLERLVKAPTHAEYFARARAIMVIEGECHA